MRPPTSENGKRRVAHEHGRRGDQGRMATTIRPARVRSTRRQSGVSACRKRTTRRRRRARRESGAAGTTRPPATEGGDPSMTAHATAELPRDLAARRLYITTRLANELVDELDQLERQLLGGLLDQARLRGRVDDIPGSPALSTTSSPSSSCHERRTDRPASTQGARDLPGSPTSRPSTTSARSPHRRRSSPEISSRPSTGCSSSRRCSSCRRPRAARRRRGCGPH